MTDSLIDIIHSLKAPTSATAVRRVLKGHHYCEGVLRRHQYCVVTLLLCSTQSTMKVCGAQRGTNIE